MSTCENTSGDRDLCGPHCGEHTWEEPCEVCGEPVTVSNGRIELMGPCHTGCFGFPFCACHPRHRGECPTAADAVEAGPPAERA